MTKEASTLERFTRHAERVGIVYAAGNSLALLAKNFRARWDNWHSYTVSVDEEDPVYPFIHAWLIETLPEQEHRSLTVHSTLDRGIYIESAEDAEEKRNQPHLTATYSGTKVHQVKVGDHDVKVQVVRPGTKDENQIITPGQITLKTSDTYRPGDPDKIVFTAQDPAGQKAVWAMLEEIVSVRKARKYKPALWMLAPWGQWQRRADLPTRSLDSVILQGDQRERIVADLEVFLAAEDEYNRLGIPWHRGYLFHGPPGTGKSSLPKALAEHFGLDIWYAPLGDLSKDTSLLNLVREVRGARSILLLEDVGTFLATQDRERSGPTSSTQKQVSLSGLLNALDGVATPHGLITIMTDNNISQIDSALIRTGRMDLVEEFRLPDDDQVRRLFTWYYGREPELPVHAPPGKSVSDLIEFFRSTGSRQAERVLDKAGVRSA